MSQKDFQGPGAMGDAQFRHEWKFEISAADMIQIRHRLQLVASLDPHAKRGGKSYLIRSLYFDTPKDAALFEKIDGIDSREKFRLRCYNGDFERIRLEKKHKAYGIGQKFSAPLSRKETQDLLENRLDWLEKEWDKALSGKPHRELVLELAYKMREFQLSPKAIVEYTREPYVFAPGNVRVTFDYNLHTGLWGVDFLNRNAPLVPAGDAPLLMEVKWDRFLPAVIQDAILSAGRPVTSFSKYAQCRIYG